jgi:putative nucleotidyltransferase with HDIG domain
MSNTLARPARPWALRLLPPFPEVANRVLSLVSDEGIPVGKIGALIKTDPTFMAEILRVANSPLFGLRREIATVEHAVTTLGLSRVKSMATLIALNGMVKPALKIESLRRVWTHSLATALLSEELARAANSSVDVAYTAGMLHNLGSLGLMSAYPEEYDRMLGVSRDCGFDLIPTERDLFEIDHCAAGAYLAEEWNFPHAIIEAIATHHEQPRQGATLSNLLRVAWRLADILDFAAFPHQESKSYDELIGLIPIVRKSWLTAGADAARTEVAMRLETAPK